jgi:hypothetical protein
MAYPGDARMLSIKKYFIPDTFFWRLLAGKEGKRHFVSLVHNSPLHWWIGLLTPARGTLSILFGVHQFIWHPITVARAWHHLYGKWPTWTQWVAIFCHDLGYLGKPDMDGTRGKTHPVAGANLACDIVYYIGRLVYRNKHDAALMAESTRELCLWHSTHYAEQQGGVVSELYLPDKVCVLFDPPWFYKLRGKISGEIYEYVENQNRQRWMTGQDEFTVDQWLTWYRQRMHGKAIEFLHHQRVAIILANPKYTFPDYCECDICVDKER